MSAGEAAIWFVLIAVVIIWLTWFIDRGGK
jgi:hypothetical protein